MWTAREGVKVCRALQPVSREFNYHLTLGGGVLNRGKSDKDLDLYFLPMGGFNEDVKSDPDGMLRRLEGIWGKSKPLCKNLEDKAKYGTTCYKHAVKFILRATNQRIDCFIF